MLRGAALLLLLVLWRAGDVQGVGRVEIVGENVRSQADYDGPLTSGAKKAFLLSKAFDRAGVVFAFLAYFKTAGPTHMQVWRPVGTDYQLIYDQRFVPTPTEHLFRRTVIMVPKCFAVLAGDRLGFMNERDHGSLAFVFVDAGLDVKFYSIVNDTFPQLRATLTFDKLDLPYAFSLASVYDTDMEFYDRNEVHCRTDLSVPPEPTTTVAPPNPTVDPRGPPGEQGPQGEKGEPGSTGERGLVGPLGPAGQKGSTGKTGLVGTPGLPGTRGKTGSDGEKGSAGERGEGGPPGERGLPGAAGLDGAVGSGGQKAANTDEQCECGKGLLHPNLILGLIVWLLVLTFLVIMLLIIMTRRHSELAKRQSVRTLQRDNPWYEGMKDDQWKEYSVETISNPR